MGDDPIRAAAANLEAEVAGLAPFEDDIRDVIGNTNWTILHCRRAELRALLAAPAAKENDDAA